MFLHLIMDNIIGNTAKGFETEGCNGMGEKSSQHRNKEHHGLNAL